MDPEIELSAKLEHLPLEERAAALRNLIEELESRLNATEGEPEQSPLVDFSDEPGASSRGQ